MKQQWRRRLAYGSNATLVSAMVVGVLVLLYVLALQSRVRFDYTEEGRNTLSADMIAKIDLLDADGERVDITAFSAQRGKEDAYFKDRELKDLLREIGNRGVVVNWRFVDFDRERLTAERLGVTEYSHVVVQRGSDRVDIRARDLFRRRGAKDKRRVEFLGEGAVARAFSQLHTPRRQVVYVLEGHGEFDLEERGPEGLSDLVDALDIERYDVESLNLLATGRSGEIPRVPDDAAVVFVARPTATVSAAEEDILLSFLGRGGSILFAVDVDQPVPSLVGRLGVSIPSGIATGRRVVFPFWDRPIPKIHSHPATQGLREGRLTPVLSHVAPVQLATPMPDGVSASPLLSTGRDGWIERGGELRGGAPVYEPELDGAGPVKLAVALELRPGGGIVRTGKAPARVVVLGDGDVLSNSMLSDGPGNSTFALELVHWLAGADRRVASVGARRGKVRRLALTKQQMGSLRWLSMGLLPFCVVFLGFAVQLSRRGR